MRTYASRPASSSRTSSPGSAAGPKLNAPGLAGLETTLVAPQRLAHRRCERHAGASPTATRCTTPCERSPMRPESTSCSTCCSTATSAIVEVFSGDLLPAHAPPASRRRIWRWLRWTGAFDVVVTTNSGFPLDQNLYQAVKGMSAGAAVVKPGGTMICAAECRDGFPDHGSYRDVLASQPSPRRCCARSKRARSPSPTSGRCRCRPGAGEGTRGHAHRDVDRVADLASAHLELHRRRHRVDPRRARRSAGATPVRPARGSSDDPVLAVRRRAG